MIAEINKFASETYKLNHKREIPYQVEDVKHCSQADYSQAISTYTGNLLNHPTLSQNDVDILKINLEHIFLAKSTHSCKDITTGNPNRDTTSERSQAIYRILDFVDDGQPNYVLIENGQGYCNLQFYHMVKSIIPNPKLRAFEQAYVKKSPLLHKFLNFNREPTSISS